MINTAENATERSRTRPRTWLRDIEPVGVEYDDWTVHFRWDLDLDAAISHLRARDAHVDALFRIAEGEGLGIVPVWPPEGDSPHPLAELVELVRDTDWIMVVATTVSRSSFTAEMIVNPLAPTYYSLHRSPAWTIYVTAH